MSSDQTERHNETHGDRLGLVSRSVLVPALDTTDPLVPENDASSLFPKGSISKWTLMRYRKRRAIPYVIIGRKIYYRYSDLLRFLEKGRVESRR